MTSPELPHLLRLLDDRNTELGPDDVTWAFESQKTKDSTKRWVNEFLTPANLLTTEELTFFESHGSSISNATSSRHISDDEFEAAIQQLENSTAAIDKQCRLLEAQKRALQTIQKANGPGDSNDDDKSLRKREADHKRGDLDSEASELTNSVKSRLQTSMKQSRSALDSLPYGIHRVLEKDDRLLDGLDKFLPQTYGLNGAESEYDEIQSLCQALVTLSASEIRSRVDMIYSTAVQSKLDDNSNGVNGVVNGTATDEANGAESQAEALRAELSELCREIDGLASMAVENQYRLPISRALESAKQDVEAERAAWADYTAAALDYMISRLDLLSDHVQTVNAHDSALKAVSAALEAVLARNASTVSSSTAMGNASNHKNGNNNGRTQSFSGNGASASETAASRTGGGLRLLRLVQANLSPDTQDPTAQLLRHLDVKVSGDMTDAGKLAEELAATAKSREAKVAAQAANTNRAVSDLLVQSLGRSEADVAVLEKALYVHSPFGRVRLADGKAEEMMQELEGKTDVLSDEMRGLDLEEMMKSVRKSQKGLLEKN